MLIGTSNRHTSITGSNLDPDDGAVAKHGLGVTACPGAILETGARHHHRCKAHPGCRARTADRAGKFKPPRAPL